MKHGLSLLVHPREMATHSNILAWEIPGGLIEL